MEPTAAKRLVTNTTPQWVGDQRGTVPISPIKGDQMQQPNTRKLKLAEVLQSAGKVGKAAPYLHLKLGASADVVFVGDALEYQCGRQGDRTMPWRPEQEAEGKSPEYRVGFAVIKLDEMRAYVLDVTAAAAQRIARSLDGCFDEKVVTLTKSGDAHDSRTWRVNAEAVRPLTCHESDELDAIPLPNLEEVFARYSTEAKR